MHAGHVGRSPQRKVAPGLRVKQLNSRPCMPSSQSSPFPRQFAAPHLGDASRGSQTVPARQLHPQVAGADEGAVVKGGAAAQCTPLLRDLHLLNARPRGAQADRAADLRWQGDGCAGGKYSGVG